MRKVIQITAAYQGNLYALCDDGSMWYKSYVMLQKEGDAQVKQYPKWVRIIDIPQDEQIPRTFGP